MTKNVISIEHLTKKYDLGVIGSGTLTRDLERWWARIRNQPDPYTRIGQEDRFKRYGESILALDDVSFTVEQGQTLGIIGRNGAGKSTLLKILSRVTAPTSGVVKVKGRFGSLLEIGTGFHPELTGRENVYLNGAILGMKKEEVARKFDEIVDFSGVEKFIDTPVKRYSSGMYVRLGFAVAAHLDPEILIVDEVLAVGDADFQRKCLGKMGEVAREGRTVLFVSHNMVSIQNLCKSALLLENGKITQNGATEAVITSYLTNSKPANRFYANTNARIGDYRVRIDDFSIFPLHPQTGQALKCSLRIYVNEKIRNSIIADISISFKTEYGQNIFQLHSGHVQHGFSLKPGFSVVSAEVKQLLLTPGSYHITLWVGSGKTTHDWIPEAYQFQVFPGAVIDGIYIDHRGYPMIAPSNWSLSE